MNTCDIQFISGSKNCDKFLETPQIHNISEATLFYHVWLWSWTHPKQSGTLQRPCSDKYNILHVVSDKWRTSTLCYFQIWWELQSEVVRGFGARQSSIWSGAAGVLCSWAASSGLVDFCFIGSVVALFLNLPVKVYLPEVDFPDPFSYH